MAKGKQAFIRALAEYLVGSQAEKSVELQLGKRSAVEWQVLRSATPLFGYPTVDEARRIRDSVAAARAMGLREGDEVARGDNAYAVVRISDDGVEGKPTKGCHVCHGSNLPLDMSLPGWSLRPPRGV